MWKFILTIGILLLMAGGVMIFFDIRGAIKRRSRNRKGN